MARSTGSGAEPASRKLAQVTTVPVTLGFLRGQAELLREHGFETVVVSSAGEALDRFAQSEGVVAREVAMTRRISPLSDLRSVARMWSVLQSEGVEIVHAHTPKAGMVGMLGAMLAGCRIRIYHLHGLRFETTSGLRRRLLRLTEVLSCRLADRVLCVSRSVRQAALDARLCPAGKIAVPHHGSVGGVDAAARFAPERIGWAPADRIRTTFRIPAGAPVVGFVGRLVRDKGVVELATAWRSLSRDHADLHMLVVGPQEEEDPVPPAVIESLRADPRVHLTGWVRAPEEYYSAMDVLMLPSYREGLPQTVLEASAMALPVVATRAAGCVDAVVDGKTGTLVPVGDATALAEAVGRYLSGPDLRTEHGQAGRRRVLDDFRPEDLWQATLEEYEALLDPRRPAGA